VKLCGFEAVRLSRHTKSKDSEQRRNAEHT
jgi:hypothetical protein